VKQTGIPGIMLFQPVEAELVDEQNLWNKKEF
jgi:hypothetical protein